MPTFAHLAPGLLDDVDHLGLRVLARELERVVLEEHEAGHILQGLRLRVLAEALLLDQEGAAVDQLLLGAALREDLRETLGVLAGVIGAPAQIPFATVGVVAAGDLEARQVLRPGAFRDRLTKGTYVSFDPKDVLGRMEDALLKVTAAEEIETKFLKAIRRGKIERRLDRDAIADAVELGILNHNEAEIMRAADEATDYVIAVDEFAPGELGANDDAPAPKKKPRRAKAS